MPHIPDEPPDGFLSHVISYEYTKAIGEVVSKWALLEHEIDVAIWDFAGLLDDYPKIGACLTAQYSTVAARFNALLALVHLRGVPEHQIAKLNKFTQRIFGLAERRNRVAHDPWLADWTFEGGTRIKQTYRLHKTARAKLEYALKPIEIKELEALIEEIEKAIQDFKELELQATFAPHEIR